MASYATCWRGGQFDLEEVANANGVRNESHVHFVSHLTGRHQANTHTHTHTHTRMTLLASFATDEADRRDGIHALRTDERERAHTTCCCVAAADADTDAGRRDVSRYRALISGKQRLAMIHLQFARDLRPKSRRERARERAERVSEREGAPSVSRSADSGRRIAGGLDR